MANYLKYKNRILELIKKKIWILDGNERSTDKPLKILYIGTEKNKEYIKKMTYENHCKEEYLGKKFFLSIYYLLIINRYRCSLVIIEGKATEQYLYGEKKNFFVPVWLDTVVDLPLLAVHHQAKEDLRILRKNKLEHIVTRDTDLLHDFYYNMHLPMIQSRYKTGALEISYNEVVESMKEECYELLLIKKKDLMISGVLLNSCDKVPRLWKNGIRDFKYLKEGAIAAAYVYGSDYLYKKGYKKISLGTLRSFLSDGLVRYKKRWDITLKISKISGEKGYILKPLIMTDALKGFYENNPFIYRKNDKLYGAVFIDKNKEYIVEEYEKFLKKYNTDGLSGLNVFSIRGSEIIQRTDCVKKD